MANSYRFKLLEARINFLNNSILPQIKILGDYTDIEFDFTRSYILLAHAEIESFLEDRVYEKTTKCLSNWQINRKKSHCIKSIIAFYAHKINVEKHKSSDLEKLEYRINLIVSNFLKSISGNNGVKKANILDLLLPIGIERASIDDTWLATMDSFGSKRGLIAHKSQSVIIPLDPITERDQIKNIILPELKKIDLNIVKIT